MVIPAKGLNGVVKRGRLIDFAVYKRAADLAYLEHCSVFRALS